jgi:hypothetical protein
MNCPEKSLIEQVLASFMKMRLIFALMIAAVFAVAAPARAQGRGEVSFEFFYDSLYPYGEWIEVPKYGYCWRPWSVDSGWAPYTDGYWAYTDAGWTWVSYEDWGSITYHYGRWMRIARVGWVWVPDYEWGPAWVSWRSSNDYIGWAPLPPEVRFVRSSGINIWVDLSYGIGPSYYNFCSYRDFGAPVLRPVIINRNRNVTIISRTTNITNITVNTTRNVIFNGGLDPRWVERRARRRIPTLSLVKETNPAAIWSTRGGHYSWREGNQLRVVAPQIVRTEGRTPTPRYTRALQNPVVDTGWSALSAAQARTLKATMFRQIGKNTPYDAPARPAADQHLRFFQERIKTSPVASTPAVAPAQTPVPQTAPLSTQPPAPAQPEDRRDRRGKPELAAPTAPAIAQPAVPAATQEPAPEQPVREWMGRRNRPQNPTAPGQEPQVEDRVRREKGSQNQQDQQIEGDQAQQGRMKEERDAQRIEQQRQREVERAKQQALEQQKEQQRQQDASQQQKEEAERGRRRAEQEAAEQQRRMEAEQARQQELQRQQEAEQARMRAEEQQQSERQRQQEERIRQQREAEVEQARQRAQQEAVEQQRQERARRRAEQEAAEQHRRMEAEQARQQDLQRRQEAEQARQRAMEQQQAERQRQMEEFRARQQQQAEEMNRRAAAAQQQQQEQAPQHAQPQQQEGWRGRKRHGEQ